MTNIIEKFGQLTPGIEHIQSTSSPGISVIAITFNLEKKIDVAFNEVQAKVNQVLRRLPRTPIRRSSPRSKPTPSRSCGWRCRATARSSSSTSTPSTR